MENDKLQKGLRDIGLALMLLSRLPVPLKSTLEDRSPARAAWAYPVAGGVVAVVAAIIALFASGLGMTAPLQAGLALATLVVVTGAMHEDGLADCADGFWGGWDRAQRLEIMRDSRIGAYGVIALVLGLGMRALAYGTLFAAGQMLAPLLVAATLSRAAMVQVMDQLPNAREDGLSKSTGRPGPDAVRFGYVIAALLAVLLVGLQAILPVVIAVVTSYLCGRLAMAKIGGQTGDVLGASQQVAELAVLLSLVALL